MRPERIASLNKGLVKNNIVLGEGTLVENRLELGDLSGNYFKIVLRDIQGISNDQIKNAVSQLSANGFINYFGMQRFGTGQVSTAQLGKAMVSGDYADLIRLLLAPRTSDFKPERLIEARKKLSETMNFKEALDSFPVLFNSLSR